MAENQDIKVDIARSMDDLQQAFDLRRAEFVQKQHVPESAEFDGNDFTATHVLAKQGDTAVGTLRIRYFHDFVRFERMCVKEGYRGQDVVDRILNFASDFLKRKGFDRAHCFCKAELVPYWEKRHHHRILDAPVVHAGGMELYPMCFVFPSVETPIQMNGDPKLLIAPEGKWEPEKPSVRDALRAARAVGR